MLQSSPILIDLIPPTHHDVPFGSSDVKRANSDKMLLAALQEVQSVVRSYDHKAQIVGVGYILALNLVLHFGDLLPTRMVSCGS